MELGVICILMTPILKDPDNLIQWPHILMNMVIEACGTPQYFSDNPTPLWKLYKQTENTELTMFL